MLSHHHHTHPNSPSALSVIDEGSVRFMARDNAADEGKACRLMKSDFPNLDFDMADPAHSRLLVYKHAIRADEEVQKAHALLVTNKRPDPSLASFLTHSTRFASTFAEDQRTACQQVSDVAQTYSRGSESGPFIVSHAYSWRPVKMTAIVLSVRDKDTTFQ
jgi:hypothetical protein